MCRNRCNKRSLIKCLLILALLFLALLLQGLQCLRDWTQWWCNKSWWMWWSRRPPKKRKKPTKLITKVEKSFFQYILLVLEAGDMVNNCEDYGVVVVVVVVVVVAVIIFKTVSCRYSYDSIISPCNGLSLDVAPEPCHFWMIQELYKS